MSSSGKEAWEKYFKGSDIKTTVKKSGSLLNSKTYSSIVSLTEGDEIEVLNQDSYTTYQRGASKYVRVVSGSKIGLFPFTSVAKPLAKKPGKETVPRLNILAEDFIGEGKNDKVNLSSGLEPVKVISSITQIKDGVLDGLSTKARNYPVVIEQFKKYFDSGDYTKIDLTDISDTHVNELGTYFGEILIGLIVLSGQTSVLHPNIFVGKRVKDMLVPTDPAFLGVDSFIRTTDNKLFPISSKYGVGAKASFFGNLLPKGLKLYNNIRVGNSAFSRIAKSAKGINITAQKLESKMGSKEVLYEYGIRDILGLSRSEVQRPYGVFTKLKTGVNDSETQAVLDAIENYSGSVEGTNIMTKIKDNLPNSATSFFSRAISSQLNEDTKSITQMKEILAGKNFYQANLQINHWQKGNVNFRLINTGDIELKIIGSKASVTDINAKQGMINYELQYPR